MIEGLFNKNILFNGFFVFLITFHLSAQLAIAEDIKDDENSYDGSQYGRSSFVDTDFSKGDYRDIRLTGQANNGLRTSGALTKAGSKWLRKQTDNNDTKESEKNTEKRDNRSGLAVIAKESRDPVKDLPGDWVPDKLDPISNGGFTIAPDNGSPVPYRLNGHVDIQRGRP